MGQMPNLALRNHSAVSYLFKEAGSAVNGPATWVSLTGGPALSAADTNGLPSKLHRAMVAVCARRIIEVSVVFNI
jgi:hypothetical protein